MLRYDKADIICLVVHFPTGRRLIKHGNMQMTHFNQMTSVKLSDHKFCYAAQKNVHY